MDKDSLIEIKLSKCMLFLTIGEMNRLLAAVPATWEKAIKRGKAILRDDRREMERGGCDALQRPGGK